MYLGCECIWRYGMYYMNVFNSVMGILAIVGVSLTKGDVWRYAIYDHLILAIYFCLL